VTHAAGLHADAHLPRTGFGKFTPDNLKGSASGGNLYSTSKYGRHGELISCALDDGWGAEDALCSETTRKRAFLGEQAGDPDPGDLFKSSRG
jgi:hypothetical protein